MSASRNAVGALLDLAVGEVQEQHQRIAVTLYGARADRALCAPGTR